MAWNKPNAENQDTQTTNCGGHPWRWCGFAIIVVVALMCVAFFLFTERPLMKEKKAKVATAVQIPTVETNPSVSKAETNIVKELTVRERKLKFYRDKYGDNIPENLKPVVYFLEHPPAKKFKAKGSCDYLRFPAERQIAGLVTQPIGTYYVLQPKFGQTFDRDFLNSMLSKIEIHDDDDEKTREVKQSVIDAKKEIARLCKEEGRNPSDIMNDYAKGMYEIGRYQKDIEEELIRAKKSDMSDSDLTDYWNAANELLKKKGLEPIKMPSLIRRGKWLKRMKGIKQ